MIPVLGSEGEVFLYIVHVCIHIERCFFVESKSLVSLRHSFLNTLFFRAKKKSSFFVSHTH